MRWGWVRRSGADGGVQALVKIEDAIQGVASDFVGIFDTEEYKTGYLDCLHDL